MYSCLCLYSEVINLEFLLLKIHDTTTQAERRREWRSFGAVLELHGSLDSTLSNQAGLDVWLSHF